MLSAFATRTEAPTTCDCATAFLAPASRSDGEVSARETAPQLSERVAAASSGPTLPIQRRLSIKAFIEFFLLPLRAPGRCRRRLRELACDLICGAQSECHKCEGAVGHRSSRDRRRPYNKQVRMVMGPPEAVAHACSGIASHATSAARMVEIVAVDVAVNILQYPAIASLCHMGEDPIDVPLRLGGARLRRRIGIVDDIRKRVSPAVFLISIERESALCRGVNVVIRTATGDGTGSLLLLPRRQQGVAEHKLPPIVPKFRKANSARKDPQVMPHVGLVHRRPHELARYEAVSVIHAREYFVGFELNHGRVHCVTIHISADLVGRVGEAVRK